MVDRVKNLALSMKFLKTTNLLDGSPLYDKGFNGGLNLGSTGPRDRTYD